MSTELAKRLESAGADNMWPRFVHGTGGDRVVVAEVIEDKLVLTAEGEALLAPSRKSTKSKSAPAEDPVAEAPAEAPTEVPAAE